MVARRQMVCHRISHKPEHRYKLLEVCKRVKTLVRRILKLNRRKLQNFQITFNYKELGIYYPSQYTENDKDIRVWFWYILYYSLQHMKEEWMREFIQFYVPILTF